MNNGLTHTVRAVLERAANNDGGKIDMAAYRPMFQEAAVDAAERGWLKPSRRGKVYTITEAGRTIIGS